MKYALMSGNNAVLPGSRLRSENANFVMHLFPGQYGEWPWHEARRTVHAQGPLYIEFHTQSRLNATL